jgi:hypothetical protein
MKCIDCGKAPWDGATLIRQNPKGEAGIWRCESCNRQAVPDDLAQTLAEIQHQQRPGEVKQ